MRKTCVTCAVVGLVLLAVCWGGAGSANAQTLTHEWNFDGNFNDSVGTKTADPLTTGTAVAGTGGIAGGAATFDGINDLLFVAGTDAIPEGPFTISFWEYCSNPSNQGYFITDAAAHPEYEWENLVFRRRQAYNNDGTDAGIKGFAETGLKSVYYGNMWCNNGYWDPRFNSPNTTYWGPDLNKVLPTGEWVHHVITYYQDAAPTTGGWGEWYVNGEINTFGRKPDPFMGLQPLETEPITDPQDPFYFPNRREGFVIGNLIDNTNVAEYDQNYADNERVGPLGIYQGKIDEFQIYSGAVTPDQVRYLKNNPGANLTTYTAPGASTQPKGAHVYRWKFDGNLNGELVTSEGSTASYSGEALGGASVAGTGGVAGGTVHFDGNDDAVKIDSTSILPAGAFSLVFWSKEENEGASGGYFFTEERRVGEVEMHLRAYTTNQVWGDTTPPLGTRMFSASVNRVYMNEFGKDGIAETQSWDYDTWHQHAFIVNADGDVKWYVNNQLMIENPSYPWDGLAGAFWLGNKSDQGFGFKGYIDDFQIYNWDINATDVAWLWANAGQALAITGGGDVYQPYDVNEDGFIGADDLDVVRAHWGESGPGGKAIGDINLDEFVGADDLDQLRAHWGEVCPPVPGLVPEPSTFVLLLMGALAIIAVRRVR